MEVLFYRFDGFLPRISLRNLRKLASTHPRIKSEGMLRSKMLWRLGCDLMLAAAAAEEVGNGVTQRRFNRPGRVTKFLLRFLDR
jgi:hypothetical protein